MKKLILILVLSFTAQVSFSQTKIDFFDFVRNFDWSISESDFRVTYKDLLVEQPDSMSEFLEISGLIPLDGIFLGKYEATANAMYNKLFDKPTLGILFNSLNAFDYLEIEKIIEQKLGKSNYFVKGENSEDDMVKTESKRIWIEGNNIFTLAQAKSLGSTSLHLIAEYREPDFRQGYWGDSMDEIKRKEGKPDEFGMENIYSFTTYVAGIECLAGYRFTDGKLTSGKYIFLNLNSDNCIQNYEKLVELLTKKYVEPIGSDKKSTASDFELNVMDEGDVVEMGKMRFDVNWVTPSTTVAIYLYGEQYQIQLGIEYYSNLHQEEMEHDVLKDL